MAVQNPQNPQGQQPAQQQPININDFADLGDPNSIIDYWNQEQLNMQPYLYQNMLRPTPITNDSLTVYFGQNELPTGLDPTADDVKANFKKSDNKIERATYSVVPYKEGRQMNEHYLNQIRSLMNAKVNDPALVQSLAKFLFKDSTVLANDAAFSREQLFEQELNTGEVAVNGNGIKQTQKLPFPANHHLVVNTSWGTTSATAIRNLTDAMQLINNDNGTVEMFAIMNQHTLQSLYDSGDVIHGLSLNKNDTNIPTNPTAAKSLVQGDSQLTIKLYNKGQQTPKGFKPFLPDGRVILVPQQVIGRLVYAPTNEQLNLTNSNKARVSNPDNGLTLTSWSSINPTGFRIVASQKVLPIIDDIRNIVVLDTNKSQSPHGNSYTVSPAKSNSNSSSNNSANGASGSNNHGSANGSSNHGSGSRNGSSNHGSNH